MPRRWFAVPLTLLAIGGFAMPVLAGIDGPAWQLLLIAGKPVADPARTRFEMQPDGKVAATVGCNRLRGKAEFDGQTAKFGPLAGTRMACPEPLMTLEADFLKELAAVASYRLDGDRMELLGADGSVRLAFGKAR